MSDPVLPIIPSQKRRAWPKYLDASRAAYLPLHIALARPYTTDAHVGAYSLPSHPYRLSSGAVDHPDVLDGVPIVVTVFDIDGHAQADIRAWWATERRKVIALRARHPELFIYRTRAGYRPIGVLPEPIILRTREDAEAWHQRYLTWVAYLARVVDIQADPARKDWTRLYRLPHATREPGGQPENHEVIGDARHVGTWAPEITPADVERAVSLSPRPVTQATHTRPRSTHTTGEGLFFHAFQVRGWIGQEIDAGKWAVACPWEDFHTKGERFDTSTVLWRPGPGEDVRWFHCSHAHCQGRHLQDVLGLFSSTALDIARRAAGVPDRIVKRKRVIRTASGALHTRQGKEVPSWR